jgi:hypothetical protein
MKKILIYVAGGVLLFGLWALSGQIGRFIGRSAVENFSQGRQEGAVEKAMELAVHELRKQLPMQVDEATTLQNIPPAGKAFIYYYRLSYVKDDTSIANFHDPMKRNVISNVCQQKDMRHMMNMGVDYRYVYMSADGLLVDEITTRATDC